ncbi:MAG TPA: hypothetical protein VFS54_07295 [Solirubrobacterales bacterium]|nr:hypothetical protein [Solirubrobacterales bacterium]
MRRLAGHATALVLIAAVAIGGNALAFFTANGSGTASAAVTKLNATTISAATAAAGGTVTLTWGAVTAPGAGSVTYYVTRDGGEAAGNCPTKAATTTVVTCKDSGVAIGEHSYTVTALWETWSAVSAVKKATVTIGEATKFTISGSTTTPAAGAAVNLTITAKDVNNATVTTYTGSHSLVFAGADSSPAGNAPSVVSNVSSSSAVNFGTATPLTFTSGVSTVASSKNGVLKIYGVGAASVTATEGSLTTPTPLSLTVSHATTSKFILAAASATPAVAEADDLTITAQDAYGNLATGYTGSKSLVFSGASASPAGNTPTATNSSGTAVAFGGATAVAFSDGVASAAENDGGEMVLYKSGATTVKATEGSVTTPTGVVVTVAPGAATKLVLSSSTATPVAGTGFNVTTTAQDVYGNTATAYTGSKNIVFSGASAGPGGALPNVVNAAGSTINFGSATALTFTSGVATPASSKNGFTKLALAGATSVSATDGTLSTATPLALTVSVGTAAKLALSELTVSAGVIGSPCYFTCAVSALGNAGTVKAKILITDSMGNVVSNVGAAKTVTVTATGGTIGGSPLTVPASGLAVSGTPFTYSSPASGSFTNTITAASSGYSSATVTATK